MKVIALSGWGQPHDALAAVFPHAEHIDYFPAKGFDDALLQLPENAKPEVLVGWSMGGQLAVRAVAEKRIIPRLLVLLATPLRFVKTPEYPFGLRADTASFFRENYARDPHRTMKKSYALIAHNDVRAEHVKPQLHAALNRLQAHDWAAWYDALSVHTPGGYIQHSMPPTLIVHGEADAVVAHQQAEAWKRYIPHARTALWEGCGHAPHWHDRARLQHEIAQALRDV